MSIGLSTFIVQSLVYLPRSISIPDSPVSISHFKMRLKSLAKSPFHRLIVDNNSLMFLADADITDGKNGSGLFCSPDGNEGMLSDWKVGLALTEEDDIFDAVFGFVGYIAVDIISRCFLKINLWVDAKAKNIFASAGSDNIVWLSSSKDQMYFFKKSIDDRIHFKLIFTLCCFRMNKSKQKSDGYKKTIPLKFDEMTWWITSHFYNSSNYSLI